MVSVSRSQPWLARLATLTPGHKPGTVCQEHSRPTCTVRKLTLATIMACCSCVLSGPGLHLKPQCCKHYKTRVSGRAFGVVASHREAAGKGCVAETPACEGSASRGAESPSSCPRGGPAPHWGPPPLPGAAAPVMLLPGGDQRASGSRLRKLPEGSSGRWSPGARASRSGRLQRSRLNGRRAEKKKKPHHNASGTASAFPPLNYYRSGRVLRRLFLFYPAR